MIEAAGGSGAGLGSARLPDPDAPLPPGPQAGISVVIVSYNVRELLDACLQSIRHAASNFEHPVEIIVFDNDSRDGTVSLLAPRWPEATWLPSDRNLGFGSGCNRGAAVATRELLLFLNPDTLVREDTFRVMWEFFGSTANVGAAGCKVVNRDGTLQAASKRSFPSPRVAAYKALGLGSLFPRSRSFGRYNLTYLDENETHEVDAVSGSFLCVRASVFAEVNGFDEDFFMYGEDLDLCYRIKLTGRSNYYHPATQVVHFKGESAKSRPLRSFLYFYEAMIIFSRKHLELRTLPRALLSAGVMILALVNFVSSRFRKWPRWLADLLVVNGTLALMNLAYQHVLGKPSFFMTGRMNYFLWHILASLSVLLPIAYIGEYGSRVARARQILPAASIGFLAFFSLSFLLREQAWSRVAFVSTAAVSLALLVGWRWISGLGGKLLRRIMEGEKRVAIVGTNPRAQALAALIQNQKIEGYEHVGFIHFPPGSISHEPAALRAGVIGDLSTLGSLARKLELHAVIVVLEDGMYPAALQVLAQQKSRVFEVKMLVGVPEPGRITLVDLNFAK